MTLLRLSLAASLLLLTGCRKPPSYYFTNVTLYPEATVTVGGKTSDGGVLAFKAGEVSEHEVATLTYATPCGKATVTASPTKAPNSNGVLVVYFPLPKNTVKLHFDPAFDGHELEAPRLKILSPKQAPEKAALEVVFGDCPRTVKLDGRTVNIPDTGGRSYAYVFVARDPKACYLSGTALYGEAKGRCVEETSETLTGQDAYIIHRNPEVMFSPVSTSVKIAGTCTNTNYLQHCK